MKQMTETNPTEPAWRRIVIDAGVIIASILAAFAIDAWWAERQAREELASLVELLVVDLEADVAELTYFAERSDMVIANIEKALGLGAESSEAATSGEVRIMYLATTATAQVDPSLSAFDVARGSDTWSNIPSSIKVEITDYVKGPFLVDRNRDLHATNELAGIIARRYAGLPPVGQGDPDTWPIDTTLAYLRDPEVRTWLGVRLDMLSLERAWQRQWLKQLPEFSEQLRPSF